MYVFTADANANVNQAPKSCHNQSPIKHSTVHPKQVEYDERLLGQIRVFVA